MFSLNCLGCNHPIIEGYVAIVKSDNSAGYLHCQPDCITSYKHIKSINCLNYSITAFEDLERAALSNSPKKPNINSRLELRGL